MVILYANYQASIVLDTKYLAIMKWYTGRSKTDDEYLKDRFFCNILRKEFNVCEI